MFEHFNRGENDTKFALEDGEVEQLAEIADELAGFDRAGDMDEVTKAEAQRLVRGVAIMSFRAGRSYQVEVTDTKSVTVHIPVEKAGKFIEMLLEEE